MLLELNPKEIEALLKNLDFSKQELIFKCRQSGETYKITHCYGCCGIDESVVDAETASKIRELETFYSELNKKLKKALMTFPSEEHKVYGGKRREQFFRST